MKGKRILATIITLVTILSMGLSTSVYAGEKQDNKINITTEEESQIVGFLHDNGVDDKTTKNLIKKFKKGIMWDSLKEEYKDIEPAFITESPDGTITQKFVYPDGSICVSTMVVPKYDNQSNDDQTISPMSVGGGTWVSGTGYRICYGAYVSESYGIISGSFYADFTLIDGGYDYISNAYDYDIFVAAATITDVSMQITRPTETALNKAEAKLQWTWTLYGGSGSAIAWVKLNVGQNSYSSSHN